MRWAAYAGVSTTLAAGVLVKALSERPNFYSAAVYLAQSTANLMILTNFIFLCACVILLGLQKLLYGPLRPIEIEQLYERGWLFVTETCLSMTIFRGSFGAWFMVMFFSLLTGKVWGWIGEGRVEILEQQPPANPRLFHTRLAISLSLSVLFATYMLEFSIRTVLAQAKPDMMVMFGFEFAILSILSISTAARYAICLAEIYIVGKQKTARLNEVRAERVAANEAANTAGQGISSNTTAEPTPAIDIDEADLEVEGWDGKGRWIFYLDLVTDFLKLTVYVAFFSVLLGFYGLPLHIMRDLFLSFRSFFKRVADFVRYRNATRDMHVRYPDATPDEVGREDVCIICREEMRPVAQAVDANAPRQRTNPVAERMRPKKLPCGHILHFSCLRSWLERQQNCPTCRRPVVVAQRTQGAAANRPALPDNAAGEPGGAAHPGNAPEQAARNRARVINFGPLRIGFGAGGGNLIDDLAQQIHNGEQRPPAEQPVNVGGRQQFGFGFGFGRRPNTHNPTQTQTQTPTPTAPIQSQLDQIERSLQQQINSLRMASNELHLVRMLNMELLRLRNLQANTGHVEAAVPQLPHVASAPLPPLGQNHFPSTGHQPPPTMLSSQTQQPLSVDNHTLPEGVTLPPGWTLMPLRRYEGPNRTAPNDNGATTAQPDTASVPLSAQATQLPSQTHSAPAFVEPSTQRSPPPLPPSNGTPHESPAAYQGNPSQAGPDLPSWGSAPLQVNGQHVREPTRAGYRARNGQANTEVGTSAADVAEATTDKDKSKAATVEDLVDDVD
ncbi:hypothetical protein EPUS_02084 [Endocarpon pusillum Z07020]|uniref:RING-type E3 ubiquitin transferase n=1 Tax=Endocarpon pusillum (strain Z07020 / HMAS-L-300199) TaxID=1263415 RepID=U1G4H0_ENDPU|nr:uncharacterized protein EPUS_02084 [Endocarpon pusillum Z07020]ERF72197.1 hypothetical protein EPUS_02084 [Endocarpon pusillum Z07020]